MNIIMLMNCSLISQASPKFWKGKEKRILPKRDMHNPSRIEMLITGIQENSVLRSLASCKKCLLVSSCCILEDACL